MVEPPATTGSCDCWHCPATEMRNQRPAAVAFAFVVILLDMIGMGFLSPALPRIVAELVGGDLAATSRYYGLWIALYGIMQFLFAPLIGAVSDRFGRRPVLLVSLLGSALDYLLLAYAPTLGWLFVGRVVSGITGANISAASAYVADLTPPEKRAQSFGLLAAAAGLGFVLGPALGGLLSTIHLRAPCFAAAALTFANFGFGLFVLPESLSPRQRRPFTLARAHPIGALRALGRTRTLAMLAWVVAFTVFAQSIIQSVWPLYAHGALHWDPLRIGMWLGCLGTAIGIAQGGVVRIAVAKLGERGTATAGLVLGAVSCCVVGFVTRDLFVYLMIIPFALADMRLPALQSILSGSVGPSEQGELQGAIGSLQSIVTVLGTVAGTLIYGALAPEATVWAGHAAPFLLAAALNFVAFGLARRRFSRLPSEP